MDDPNLIEIKDKVEVEVVRGKKIVYEVDLDQEVEKEIENEKERDSGR